MTNFCLSLNDMELQDGGTCTQGRFWRLVLPLRTLFSQQHYLACLYAQRYYEDLTEREKGDQFGPLMAHIAKLFNTGVELSRADNEGTRAHLLRELQQPLELEASYPMAWQREGGLSSSGTNFDRFSEEEQLARALEESRRAPSCEQLSEEEQLALALSASQADPSPPRHQEQGSDLELALALSASQEAASGSPSPQGHQESDLYVGLSDEDALALALALSQEEDQR